MVLGVTVALSVDSVKARSLLMLWSLLRRPLNQSVLIQLWFEKWFLNLGTLRVDCHSQSMDDGRMDQSVWSASHLDCQTALLSLKCSHLSLSLLE